MSETTIQSDFSTPEVRLEGFASGQDPNLSLLDVIAKDDATQAYQTLRGYRSTETVLSPQEMATLEMRSLQNAIDKVKDAIEFSNEGSPLQEGSHGNCYTFTWVVSEVADTLGIDSNIVFANDHMFNLVHTSDGGTHMINGDTRHMIFYNARNNPVTRDMFNENSWSEITAPDRPNYSYHSMYTTGLQVYHDVEMAKERRSIELPWLKDHVPAATVMDTETGRAAMFRYMCLSSALSKGNIKAVGPALKALEGYNPQVETRISINDGLRGYKSLVRKWSRDPDISDADIVETIRDYAAIMPETKSMFVVVGDCLRTVGGERRIPELLEGAQEAYGRAEKLGKTERDMTLLGKMDKTSAILSNVVTEN